MHESLELVHNKVVPHSSILGCGDNSVHQKSAEQEEYIAEVGLQDVQGIVYHGLRASARDFNRQQRAFENGPGSMRNARSRRSFRLPPWCRDRAELVQRSQEIPRKARVLHGNRGKPTVRQVV